MFRDEKILYDMYMLRLKWFGKQWVVVLVIVILFVMMLGLNARLSEFFRLTGQRDEMQQRIDHLKSTQAALETQIAYAASDKAAEEWARTHKKMILPGDQIIIPLPEKETEVQINYLPTPVPDESENWQIWIELLFGE